MTIWDAFLLGIIQGLTEFLPVSSSGHIELGKVILGAAPPDPLLFSIVVHAATALSTIVVFRQTIFELLKSLLRFSWNEDTRYVAKIVLSMIPVGLVGVLYEAEIEALFEGKILLVGSMLILTGALLWLTQKAGEPTGKVTFSKAFLIGLAQAIAILPGISRSGATISASLLLGVNRSEAARFSFLMVLPPILGATLLKVIKYANATATTEISDNSLPVLVLIVGFLAAFVSGLFACQWMISLVKNSKLQYFAYYCLLVGSIAIVYALLF